MATQTYKTETGKTYEIDSDGDVVIEASGSLPAGQWRSIAISATGWWTPEKKTLQVLVSEIGGERRAWRHEGLDAEDIEEAERLVRSASQGAREWLSDDALEE